MLFTALSLAIFLSASQKGMLPSSESSAVRISSLWWSCASQSWSVPWPPLCGQPGVGWVLQSALQQRSWEDKSPDPRRWRPWDLSSVLGGSRKMVEMGVSEHQGGQGPGGCGPHMALPAGEADCSTQSSAKHGPSVLAWRLDQGTWSLWEWSLKGDRRAVSTQEGFPVQDSWAQPQLLVFSNPRESLNEGALLGSMGWKHAKF